MSHQCNNQYKNQRIDKVHRKTITSEKDSETAFLLHSLLNKEDVMDSKRGTHERTTGKT